MQAAFPSRSVQESREISLHLLLWGLVLPLIVFAVRAVHVIVDPGIPYDTEHTYLPLARQLLENPSALWHAQASLKSPPGLYVLMAMVGADIANIKALNLAMALSTCVLLFDTARRLAGPIAAAVSAWLYAASPALLPMAVHPMIEPPVLFLSALWLWAMIWCVTQQQLGFRLYLVVVLAGLALAGATLTRATLMYWIPCIALLSCAALAVPRLRAWRTGLLSLALIHILALACVGAYMARTASVFGKPLIATGAGTALYFGSLPVTHGHEPPFFGILHDQFVFTQGHDHLTLEGDKRMKEAAKLVMTHTPPATLARVYVMKAGSLLFFSKSHLKRYSDRIWRVGLVTLALFALWMGRRKPAILLLGGVVLYLWAVHIPALYSARYSIVALDLPLTLLAGSAIGMALQRRRRWLMLLVQLFVVTLAAMAGAAHQRYSAPLLPDAQALPLPTLFSAAPNRLSTSGFNGDPFSAPAPLEARMAKITWTDTFPKLDAYSLVSLQIKHLEGRCIKAWLHFTAADGSTRTDPLNIKDFAGGQDFTRGMLFVEQRGHGQRLEVELECTQGAALQLGEFKILQGSQGRYYRGLTATP